jgi:disulfide oxidoreductase YuzD
MANLLNDAMNIVDKLSDDEFMYLMVTMHRRQRKIVDELESKRRTLLAEYKRLIVEPNGPGEDLILG